MYYFISSGEVKLRQISEERDGARYVIIQG